MKNILLMVPRLNIGGAETYTAMVAEKLQQDGYNVYIASGGGMLADKLAKKGIKNFWLPIRFSTDISAFLLKRIVKKYRIDLIHANSAAAGITAVKFKYRYQDIPVIFTAHGIFSNNKKEALLNKCDKIICVSNFVKQHAVQENFAKDKLLTIYTGIDEKKFNHQLDERNHETVRKMLSIPQEAFVMALVARIKNLRNKGHIDMLHIMKEHVERKNWHLLVIGKGKSLGKFKLLVHEYGLHDRIHCLGHQIDVAKYIAAADVMVLPSYFETFGLALAEGMAMGKPGITYDTGGCSEVVIDGKTGYIAKYKDENSFYEKLCMLADDKSKCCQMGAAAQTDIKARLSCDNMMRQIENLYSEYIKD